MAASILSSLNDDPYMRNLMCTKTLHSTYHHATHASQAHPPEAGQPQSILRLLNLGGADELSASPVQA